jgi:hypothetical protein
LEAGAALEKEKPGESRFLGVFRGGRVEVGGFFIFEG